MTRATHDGPDGACTATYQTIRSRPGGFQGEVTVRAGSSALNGWTVGWSVGSGQTIPRSGTAP